MSNPINILTLEDERGYMILKTLQSGLQLLVLEEVIAMRSIHDCLACEMEVMKCYDMLFSSHTPYIKQLHFRCTRCCIADPDGWVAAPMHDQVVSCSINSSVIIEHRSAVIT